MNVDNPNSSILFTPFKIGELEIKNRFIMCAMGGVKLYNLDGQPNQEVYDYYIRRAKGGVGLIVTRAIIVLPIGLNIKLFEHPEIFTPMRYLTKEVHKYDCKIFMQLSAGAGRTLHKTIEQMKQKGHDYKNAFFAPSDGIPNVWYPEIKHRGLSVEEIADYIYAFGALAKIAKEVGFDGVEIHAIHEGYLLDQFTISATNQRTDHYGGKLENRYRFPCEIIREIKNRCGINFPVSMRFSVESKMKEFNYGFMPNEQGTEFGRSVKEAIEGAKLLEKAGCDMLDADNGSYDSWYWAHPPVYMPEDCNLKESKILKNHINIPIVCAGKMDNPLRMEKYILDGNCDGIGMARAFLVDPDFVNKIAAGKISNIKPCIGCHSGCLAHAEHEVNLSCALNPTVLHEEQFNKLNLEKAPSIKQIAIIGGGIAGMQTALILKDRGHQVTIYEKSDVLGGIFNIAASFSFKKRDRKLIEWYKNEISSRGIDVRLNTCVDLTKLLEIKADEYVVAIGASPREKSKINKNIYEASDFLSQDKFNTFRQIIIVGGGLTGCEIAYEAILNGCTVTIIELGEDILTSKGLCSANRMFLLDAFKTFHVKVFCGASLTSVEDNIATIKINQNDNVTLKLHYDAIVLATGYDNQGIKIRKSDNIHIIGDANNVGNLMTAINDAYKIGYKL